jgi:hypothetical protein
MTMYMARHGSKPSNLFQRAMPLEAIHKLQEKFVRLSVSVSGFVCVPICLLVC